LFIHNFPPLFDGKKLSQRTVLHCAEISCSLAFVLIKKEVLQKAT